MKPDTGLSAAAANYHSAFIESRDGTFYGIALGKAELNEKYTFSVKGIGRGIIRVSSVNCHFDQSQYYKDSAKVHFTITMQSERCLFGISVLPQFTKEEAKGQAWRSVSGVMLVRRPFFSSQFVAIKQPRDKDIMMRFEPRGASTLYVVGCGINLKQEIQESVQVILPEAQRIGDCVMEAIMQNDKDTDLFVFFVSRYLPDYQKLSFPSIWHERNFIAVESELNVSFMSFQGASILGNSKNFGYNDQLDKILVLYSSQGRTVYCRINRPERTECFN